MKTHQDRANTLLLQANAAKENGNLEEAVHAYREAMSLVPAYNTFNLVIANLFLEAKRYQEAVEAFRNLLIETPAHEQAWIGLGQCQMLMDNHEDAIVSFRSALDVNHNNIEANYYLALLLAMRTELKEAESFLFKALKQRPSWEAQARMEASLKPVFENSRRLANLGRKKKWWEVWK